MEYTKHKIMPETTKLASSHYMQSEEWAQLRTATGWEVLGLALGNNKLVHAYRKKTPLGGVLYIPGFMPAKQTELASLTKTIKSLGNNLTCKLEPCVALDETKLEWFTLAGWKLAHNVQYEHTVILDLSQPESDLWTGMKSRGRQEINYARRDGVSIVESDCNADDFEVMESLLRATSERKAFGIREKRGVLKSWQSFRDAGRLRLFFAKHDGKVIAGGVFITNGHDTVWYKEAGSLPAYNKVFGPRLLLWEAALAFKKDGYALFDLGGTPAPEDYEHSSMKGVYIFKTAFARQVTTMMPAYELPLKPLKQAVWQKLEPAAIRANRMASTAKGKLLGRR